MRTVILGERPPALEDLIAHRRAKGTDLYDEVWEGDYHMNPAPRKSHALLESELLAVLRGPVKRAGLYPGGIFNLGDPDNFRVPDVGVHRDRTDAVWVPTAALVVEILSPDDESWEKLPFYAAHGVDEVVIADPAARTLAWMERDEDDYRRVERSALLGVEVGDIVAEIDWPPVSS
jgi:hypothetical protein